MMPPARDIAPNNSPLEVELEQRQKLGLRPNIEAQLRFLGWREGEAIELQTLATERGRFVGPERAWARSLEAIVRLAEEMERLASSGIYVLGNRIKDAVASRGPLEAWQRVPQHQGTVDPDIEAYRAILIDCDFERPRNTSATEAEMLQTVPIALAIHAELGGLLEGTDAIAYTHTGNGRNLLLALEDGNDDPKEIAKRASALLIALDRKHGRPPGRVDVSCHEPKRLQPLAGTLKRKGWDGVVERPHRRTAIVVPERPSRARRSDLDMLIASVREGLEDGAQAEIDRALGIKRTVSSSSSSSSTASSTSGKHPPRTETAFSRANAIPIADVLRDEGLMNGDHPECPGCRIADGTSVAITPNANGLKCLHARCAAKGIKGFWTPVDVVAERRSVAPREAVVLMAERYGFEGFAEKKAVPSEDPPAAPKVVRRGLSVPDVLGRWREHGPVERIPTGWPTFDRVSRGGLVRGKCTFIVGAPNAMKTGAGACLASRWAHQGMAVAVLGVDEDPDDFLMRIAQQAGYGLDECERRDPEAMDGIDERCGSLPIRFYNFEWSIEAAAADFATFMKETGCDRGAFFADSLQTIRSDLGAKADNPRAVVDANVFVLRALAQTNRWAVVATSEASRIFYRNTRQAAEQNAMAAGKETGGIEYGAMVQLVLTSVPNEPDVVKVQVPKVKRGTQPALDFYLRFDRRRHGLTECPPPESEDEEVQEGRKRARAMRQAAEDARRLEQIILRTPGIGQTKLRVLAAKEGVGGKDRVMAALDELGARVVNRGTEQKHAYHIVAAAPASTRGQEEDVDVDE